MGSFHAEDRRYSLQERLGNLIERAPTKQNGDLIQRAFDLLVGIAGEDLERLDWKILTGALQDMQLGFRVFRTHTHTRKVAIFGSARIATDTPEYAMARDFARCLVQQGFAVMTGGGGGIMQAGNEGAGAERSFGLNIQLPFEQDSNPYIAGDPKAIDFKYFFTRKLFFLKESDAIALFPGGYGTQDEAFECLTLCQTGRHGPVPLVLVDKPGGNYWRAWHEYVCEHLIGNGLVSPEDAEIYTLTDDLDVACAAIQKFYRLYHSSRYAGRWFVMRLNAAISQLQLRQLNEEFGDILRGGAILQRDALPEENGELAGLPRLVFDFNQRDLGRLYQLIRHLNDLDIHHTAEQHPEWK
ncbi:putative Rossmann fold nucleotide-binding protein [Rubidibacter lacunae KORDI 51-2]|uniref:Putative Rossmann fold nucleotide-binding protein n=1 Tax=Rubidibacter lacunae KORDI 51-2 TaxID=582515 RepID=U5DKM4_9CHRO|nr:LOG family protein [Rubidibacter lacunae]ERN41467.1 putative Rossmann fold nucleotide-binding protein [Rubidibacter lacunae KORDI 51-2]